MSNPNIRIPIPLDLTENQGKNFDTLSLIKREIETLKEKSLNSTLDYTDTKRLEILIKMDKLIYESKEKVDISADDEYTDEEVDSFIEHLAEWKKNGQK